MNSIKKEIDSCFNDYKYKSGYMDIFKRYEKRKKKIKIFSTVFSVVFAFSILFFCFAGDFTGFNSKSNFGIKAHALTVNIGNDAFNKNKKLLKNSHGIKRCTKKVKYDKNGNECVNGKKPKKTGFRDVIVPSPIVLKIFGKGIKTIRVNCGENGSLYNAKYDNLNGKKIKYKSNLTVNWIPNCRKLTSSLSVDALKVPSTMKSDRIITRELRQMLKTGKDYNKYFGDTVKITAFHKDKSVENVAVNISLDKNGKYYISVKE